MNIFLTSYIIISNSIITGHLMKTKNTKVIKAGKYVDSSEKDRKARILEGMKMLKEANQRIMEEFMRIDNLIEVLEGVSGPNIQNAINELLQQQDQLRLLDEQNKKDFPDLYKRWEDK